MRKKSKNFSGTKEKRIAIKAAKSAGKILLKGFKKEFAGFKTKSNHEILTKFDVEAEKAILDLIKKEFPNHQILSEESGNNNKASDYLWIIDPLDGTTNFVMKNPLFAVSIALAYKNKVILGVIYLPYMDELFTAEINKGAFFNDKPIKISSRSNIIESLLTFCSGADQKDFKRAVEIYKIFKTKSQDLRQFGSAACELAWVACARTDAIMIAGDHPWDVAAGALIVREAGGKVTNFKGGEWDINSGDIVASNKKINNALIKFLKTI